MQKQPTQERPIRRAALRIERAAAEVNAMLLMLAIGLAVLDLTCFSAFKLSDALHKGVAIPSAGGTATSWSGNLVGLPPAAASQAIR